MERLFIVYTESNPSLIAEDNPKRIALDCLIEFVIFCNESFMWVKSSRAELEFGFLSSKS